MNHLHPFLTPATEELLSRCVCVCDQNHSCLFAQTYSMFVRRILVKKQRKGQKSLQDRTPPPCALLDVTSDDESQATYLGLTGRRTTYMHICSHLHFLHPPPSAPISPLTHTRTFSLIVLPHTPLPAKESVLDHDHRGAPSPPNSSTPFALERFQISTPSKLPAPPPTPPKKTTSKNLTRQTLPLLPSLHQPPTDPPPPHPLLKTSDTSNVKRSRIQSLQTSIT